ncbi:MAG: prepilin-type N-terminal cleavage/methylation domain-containing protein [Candidatus Omnitrophota bacterium]
MFRLKNKGFLLLEVMLAVTILSVGMALVLRSYVSALNAVKISQDFFAAGLLLEEKLWQKEEEKAGSQEPSVAGEQGNFSTPWDRFSYLVEFEKEENTPDLYKTNSSVSWQNKKKTHSILCVSYIRSKEK